MKTFRLPILALTGWLCLALLALTPAHAQDSHSVMTLDDAMPGIDVVINLPPDMPGAIAVEISQASVTLKDADGKVEFYMADPRTHAVELALMAGSGTHTLSITRLPGAGVGYVSLNPQAGLTTRPVGSFVPSGALTLDQQQQVILNADGPGSSIPVDIPAGGMGAITAQFEKSTLMAQLTDSSGSAVGTLYGGAVDGLSVTLDGGSYLMTLLNSDTKPVVAALNVSAVETDLLAAFAPSATEPASPPSPARNVAALSVVTPQPANCALTIDATSVNFRSGPGTGYDIVGHGASGTQYEVSGQNSNGSWLVLTGDEGELLWVSGQLGSTRGDCSKLAVYDLPTRSAAPVQPTSAPDGSLGSGNDHSAGNDDTGSSSGSDDLSAGNQGNDDVSPGNDDSGGSSGGHGSDDGGGDDHGDGSGNSGSGGGGSGGHGSDD